MCVPCFILQSFFCSVLLLSLISRLSFFYPRALSELFLSVSVLCAPSSLLRCLAQVLEDMKKLAKTFKAGTPFTFTATFRATFLEPAAGAGAVPNVDAASLEPQGVEDAEVVEPAAAATEEA